MKAIKKENRCAKESSRKAYLVFISVVVLVFISPALIGCCKGQNKVSIQEYLFNNPGTSIQFNDVWCRRSSRNPIGGKGILLLRNENGVGEVFIKSGRHQEIPNTGVFIAPTTSTVYEHKLYTKKTAIKKAVKQKPKQRSTYMSAGTWVAIFLLAVVAAKVAHWVTVRIIVRSVKKASKHIKKEWDEAD